MMITLSCKDFQSAQHQVSLRKRGRTRISKRPKVGSMTLKDVHHRKRTGTEANPGGRDLERPARRRHGSWSWRWVGTHKAASDGTGQQKSGRIISGLDMDGSLVGSPFCQ